MLCFNHSNIIWPEILISPFAAQILKITKTMDISNEWTVLRTNLCAIFNFVCMLTKLLTFILIFMCRHLRQYFFT